MSVSSGSQDVERPDARRLPEGWAWCSSGQHAKAHSVLPPAPGITTAGPPQECAVATTSRDSQQHLTDAYR